MMKVEECSRAEEVMSILLGEEIGSFVEDGFDSSGKENEIFSDVFHGTGTGGAGNNLGVLGTTGFRTTEDVHAKASICSNDEDLDLTILSFVKGLSERNDQCAEVNIRRRTSGTGRDPRNVNRKRKELSSVENLYRKKKEPGYCLHNTASDLNHLERSIVCSSEPVQNHDSVYKQVLCRTVESFSRGIFSSHYQSSYQGGVDGMGDVDTGIVLEKKQIDGCSPDKNVVREVKSVTSGSSSDLLVSGLSTAPEQTPAALKCPDHTSGEHVNLDVLGVELKKDSVKEAPILLHSHAHRLLLDVGWIIKPRKRPDRTKMAYSFVSPEGLRFRALSQAWKTCGDSLLGDASELGQDEIGREWMDIDVFWGDLADTLAYIEKDNHSDSSLSLLERWQILDPFMAVLLIDRRISALREGKALRAVRSATSFLSDRKNMLTSSSNQSSIPAIGHDYKSEHDNQEVLVKVAAQQSRKKYRRGQLDLRLSIQKRSLKSLARRIGKGLINTRIGTLREGKALRALRSATSFLSDRKNMPITSLNQSSLPEVGHDYKSEHDNQEVLVKEAAQQLQKKRRCGQVDQKRCVQERSLKSLSRRIEKGLTNTKCLPNTNHEALLGQYKKLIRPVSKSTCNLQNKGLAHPSGKLLVGNQSCQGMHVDQTMHVCHPEVKMLSEESVGYDEVSIQNRPNYGIMYDSMGVASDGPGNLEFLIHKLSSPSAHKNLSMVETVERQGASIGEPDLTSVAKPLQSSIKKAHNRSKKISEIKANDASDNGLKGNSEDEIGCSVADGIINQSDLFYQCEENAFRRESTQESAGRLKLSKKHSGNVGNVSKTKKVQSSAVDESNSTKKYKKSEAGAASKNAEGKKGNFIMHLEDEPGGTLLNVDKPQGAAAIRKSIKRSNSKSSSKNKSQQKVTPGSKKVQSHCMDSLESIVATDEGNNLVQSHSKGSNNVKFPVTGVPLDSHTIQTNSKEKKPKVNRKDGRKKLSGCHISDDDLLIAAIIKNRDFSSSGKRFASKIRSSQSKELIKLKRQRGSCKLLLRTPGKGGKHSIDKKRLILEAKTVLCWLIEMGALSLKDTIQYRNPKDNEVVKDGWVTKDGISCKCCTNVLSISNFKVHAGFTLHKPCLNLFLQSGKPYTLCQLEAWSVEYTMRKSHMHVGGDEVDQNDDTCGLCGDGGELICCDNCPSTYHQMCLPSQELPEGSWYCSNCICKICGEVVKRKEASSSVASLECSQCEHKYHDACIKEKVTCNGEVGSPSWFCRESCQKLDDSSIKKAPQRMITIRDNTGQETPIKWRKVYGQVYSGLRSHVGVLNNISDGFSWTILRCNHDDQKVHSAQRIAARVECNLKLAIALNIMEECFLSMVDPRTGIDMIPHVLYNWGSNFARLNYQGFYTIVLEKGDELVSVASIRVHGVTAAEMPLIATSSDHRRQGMCRRLMIEIEKMLISFKVKMLVLSAIPELVGTWTTGFGFKPVEDDDKQELKNVNLMLFPGTSLLKKDLCEATSHEAGLASTSSACNVTGDTDLYSQDDQYRSLGGLDERIIPETSLPPVENVTIDRYEPPVIMKMTEQFSSEQINQSSENRVLTGEHNRHDVKNAEIFSGHIRTSSLNENIQVFSTGKAVSTVISVANINADVHSCSSYSSPARSYNSLYDSSSMRTYEMAGSEEVTVLENTNNLVENSDVMKKERQTGVGDNEVENNNEMLMPQSKKGCSLSDKQTEECSCMLASNRKDRN